LGPSDEIARIEGEGVEKTRIGDWRGARALFEQALTFEMPALRRAQILRNVAGTYLKEGNHSGVQETSRRAIEVLDTAGVGGGRAEQLRNELRNLESFTGGRLPLSTFWYGVVFLAGLYWGVSFASGATFANGVPMSATLAFALPPVMCFGTACVAVGGLNSRSLLGAATLYVNFLFSFAIGYGVSSSGLIRFGYKPR
jgi:hypothetical protein